MNLLVIPYKVFKYKNKNLCKLLINDYFHFFTSSFILELVDDAGELRITPENQFVPGKFSY